MFNVWKMEKLKHAYSWCFRKIYQRKVKRKTKHQGRENLQGKYFHLELFDPVDNKIRVTFPLAMSSKGPGFQFQPSLLQIIKFRLGAKTSGGTA